MKLVAMAAKQMAALYWLKSAATIAERISEEANKGKMIGWAGAVKARSGPEAPQ